MFTKTPAQAPIPAVQVFPTTLTVPSQGTFNIFLGNVLDRFPAFRCRSQENLPLFYPESEVGSVDESHSTASDFASEVLSIAPTSVVRDAEVDFHEDLLGDDLTAPSLFSAWLAEENPDPAALLAVVPLRDLTPFLSSVSDYEHPSIIPLKQYILSLESPTLAMTLRPELFTPSYSRGTIAGIAVSMENRLHNLFPSIAQEFEQNDLQRIQARHGFLAPLVVAYPRLDVALHLVNLSAPTLLAVGRNALTHGPKTALSIALLSPFLGAKTATDLSLFLFRSQQPSGLTIAGYGYNSSVDQISVRTPFGTITRPRAADASRLISALSSITDSRFQQLFSVVSSQSTLSEQTLTTLTDLRSQQDQTASSFLDKLESVARGLNSQNAAQEFTTEMLKMLQNRPAPPTLEEVRSLLPSDRAADATDLVDIASSIPVVGPLAVRPVASGIKGAVRLGARHAPAVASTWNILRSKLSK
jgi:hypothetical protein